MACVPQLILNASQALPRSVLLSRECLCQGQFDHAVVPKRHPHARCLREAKQGLEIVDAQQSLVNFQGSHVRRELVALMARCRQRRRRLFYTLQLRGVANEMRIEQVQKALLLCVPKACDEETTRAWLSAALIGSSQLGHLEPAPCRGDGDLLLPPRLGLPSELDQGLHSYITSNGGNLDLSFVVSEGLPLIYTNLELRVPGPSFLEPKPTARSQRRGGVAVLFAGSWRFAERTAGGIRRHLLQPLKALAFAVSSGAGRLEARRKLGQLFPLKGFGWVKDLSLEDLKSLIPPKARRLYEVLGSGALSPLRGMPGGFNLHSLRKLQLVFELVKSYEKRRGYQFQWLIHSRLDLIWAAAHPPLALLDQRIWVSPLLGAGDDHPNKFCLNDWHAVVPRRFAPAYWLRWDLLLQGLLPWTPHIEPGELLAGVLHVLELPLGELDAVYCLEHCNKWSCQFKSWMPRKSRWRYGKSRQRVLQRAAGLQSGELLWQREDGKLRLVEKGALLQGVPKMIFPSGIIEYH